MDQMHYEAAFREGDSIYFRQGEITIFREELVLCIMEKDYETTLLDKPPGGTPFEGFPRYRRFPRLIKKVPTEKIDINTPQAKKYVPLILFLPILWGCSRRYRSSKKRKSNDRLCRVFARSKR